MRHSDIKLTMGLYTDPRLLDVRGALEKLPALPLAAGPDTRIGVGRLMGTDGRSAGQTGPVAPPVAPTRCNGGQSRSSTVTDGLTNESESDGHRVCGTTGNVNEKPPVTTQVIGGHRVGLTGFEPATSWSRSALQTIPTTCRTTRFSRGILRLEPYCINAHLLRGTT